MQERSGASSGYQRLEPHNFEIPQHQLAPGTKAYIGRPQGESPFVQVRILPNRKFQNKRSRAFSFVPDGTAALPRGVTRTFQAACTAATTWSFQFWNSLSQEEKEDIRTKYPPQSLPVQSTEGGDGNALPKEPPAKKPRSSA